MNLKYLEVLKYIQNKIIDGSWPEGTMIPTELELCTIHEVSRITVRRALDEMVQKGFIRRTRGKGSFVCSAKQLSEYRTGTVSQDGVQSESSITNKLLDSSVYSASTEVAKRFCEILMTSGQAIRRMRVLRYVDGQPYALYNIYVPEEIGSRALERDMERVSFVDLYAELTGERIHAISRTVSAVVPDKGICQLLNVREGSAHLWIKNVVYSKQDVPLAVNYAMYNSNLFDFSVCMDMENPPRIML